MILEREYHPALGNQRSGGSAWMDGRMVLGSMSTLPQRDRTTVRVRMSLNRGADKGQVPVYLYSAHHSK
jgi:hypothetical protein